MQAVNHLHCSHAAAHEAPVQQLIYPRSPQRHTRTHTHVCTVRGVRAAHHRPCARRLTARARALARAQASSGLASSIADSRWRRVPRSRRPRLLGQAPARIQCQLPRLGCQCWNLLAAVVPLSACSPMYHSSLRRCGCLRRHPVGAAVAAAAMLLMAQGHSTMWRVAPARHGKRCSAEQACAPQHPVLHVTSCLQQYSERVVEAVGQRKREG